MNKILISTTTLIEMGNKKFNPFNMNLDGFSRSIMMTASDFDDIFEQIHHKYSAKSRVPPEIQLVFAFSSAAIFHHAGNCVKSTDSDKKTEEKKKDTEEEVKEKASAPVKRKMRGPSASLTLPLGGDDDMNTMQNIANLI
jgi:hypothetical protein